MSNLPGDIILLCHAVPIRKKLGTTLDVNTGSTIYIYIWKNNCIYI